MYANLDISTAAGLCSLIKKAFNAKKKGSTDHLLLCYINLVKLEGVKIYKKKLEFPPKPEDFHPCFHSSYSNYFVTPNCCLALSIRKVKNENANLLSAMASTLNLSAETLLVDQSFLELAVCWLLVLPIWLPWCPKPKHI